ncbi:histidine kinase [Oscillatoria sp. FACHB-1407]|uniref:DICT sensory domain-containing protein n=1 Tax=Oscillatoria sp. FACHB-1407 TaxID=2692847 RepID=UPI0016836C63|nr:DICT sensory domain-containing protein [Oscillatoria sp. FACHB-1407]MBD2461283.1 histidine kinase [Oscillatoria sp. FACHB-1407]
MISSSLHDVSLYELALSVEQPPHPLQVSPTTFKSVVTTFLDVLIDRQIPATVLLKLPRGAVWQAEVDRYCKLAGSNSSVYSLQTHREEDKLGETPASPVTEVSYSHASEPTQPESNHSESTHTELTPSEIEDSDLIDDQGIVSTAGVHPTQNLILPLAPESQLRREYFLLVISPEFSGLVLAHRPRSVRGNRFDAVAGDVPLTITKVGQAGDDELERKHPLLGLCSFESATIQRILDGIHRAICVGQADQPLTVEVDELLQNWDELTRSVAIAHQSPLMLGQLLTRQIQQQEEIWHSNAASRRQAETAAALQMENEELLNAIRLKDEFLKNVGQELRTPLTTMKTAVTLLNSPSLKAAQRQKYMELLTQECDRQSALITSVLDLIQLENTIEHNSTQPLRLADIVPGVISTYQPLAQEKGVMVAYTIPEDLPAVSCSSAWLRQIVINLLHNGIKFTSQGGRVWVRAKQQGDYVQIEFQDTGVGIAPTDIPKIFDRFYKARSGSGDESSGAGLGLSIVQQLLLRCGGSISVKSKPGEGSIFTVLLPVYR